LPWILSKEKIIGGLCLKSQKLYQLSIQSLENFCWSTDPWKHGRNKSLLYHLAKHCLTSNTLNMECDKRKVIGVLIKIQNLSLTMVDAIDEWPNDNGILITMPKSL
jgi:hypothetical protein